MAKKSELDLLSKISKKLDRVIVLLAVEQVGDDNNNKVMALYDFGFGPATVSKSMGISPKAVKLRLKRIRKQTQEKTA